MQVDTVLVLEFIGQELDQAEVKILTAQEGVAVGCQYFELVLTVDFCDFNN